VDIFGWVQPAMRPGLDSLNNNVYACLHWEEGKEARMFTPKCAYLVLLGKKQGASART
jgi:hypothetical protein